MVFEIQKSRMFGAEEGGECHREFRLNTPCRLDQSSPKSAQGDPTSARVEPSTSIFGPSSKRPRLQSLRQTCVPRAFQWRRAILNIDCPFNRPCRFKPLATNDRNMVCKLTSSLSDACGTIATGTLQASEACPTCSRVHVRKVGGVCMPQAFAPAGAFEAPLSFGASDPNARTMTSDRTRTPEHPQIENTREWQWHHSRIAQIDYLAPWPMAPVRPLLRQFLTVLAHVFLLHRAAPHARA